MSELASQRDSTVDLTSANHGQSALSAHEYPVYGGKVKLLEAIEQLAPEISARSGEIESGKGIPADLYEKIRATGAFRMMRAKSLGGAEYPLTDALEIVEAFARADGSVGWVMMVGTEVPIGWMRFSHELQAKLFGGKGDVMTCGLATPRGKITRVDGGYELDGVWPFKSGSYPNIDWYMVAGAVKDQNGDPVLVDGAPLSIFAAVEGRHGQVLKIWDSFGLRGTESDDVRIDKLFVPEEYTTPADHLHKDGPLLGQFPLYPALVPFHMGVVLGITRAMIDEITSVSRTKAPFLNPTTRLSQDPIFQHRVASFELRLAAARSFALAETERMWSFATRSEVPPAVERARYRSVGVHVHEECMAIGNEVFKAGGTGILYNHSALQRRFRDLRSANQHLYANTDIYRPFGALLLGESDAMTAAV